ncbi:hypothetical protein BJ912DRAFT_1097937 [Pholiota molesta]|nr:hypothetical protein BJ912DRAFT_1097937 [Pholiota molesta]
MSSGAVETSVPYCNDHVPYRSSSGLLHTEIRWPWAKIKIGNGDARVEHAHTIIAVPMQFPWAEGASKVRCRITEASSQRSASNATVKAHEIRKEQGEQHRREEEDRTWRRKKQIRDGESGCWTEELRQDLQGAVIRESDGTEMLKRSDGSRPGTHNFIDDPFVGVGVEGQAGVAGTRHTAISICPPNAAPTATHYFSIRIREAGPLGGFGTNATLNPNARIDDERTIVDYVFGVGESGLGGEHRLQKWGRAAMLKGRNWEETSRHRQVEDSEDSTPSKFDSLHHDRNAIACHRNAITCLRTGGSGNGIETGERITNRDCHGVEITRRSDKGDVSPLPGTWPPSARSSSASSLSKLASNFAKVLWATVAGKANGAFSGFCETRYICMMLKENIFSDKGRVIRFSISQVTCHIFGNIDDFPPGDADVNDPTMEWKSGNNQQAIIPTRPQSISTYPLPSSATSPKRDEHKHGPGVPGYNKVRSADGESRCSMVTVVVANFRHYRQSIIFRLESVLRTLKDILFTLQSDVKSTQSDDRNSQFALQMVLRNSTRRDFHLSNPSNLRRPEKMDFPRRGEQRRQNECGEQAYDQGFSRQYIYRLARPHLHRGTARRPSRLWHTRGPRGSINQWQPQPQTLILIDSLVSAPSVTTASGPNYSRTISRGWQIPTPSTLCSTRQPIPAIF